ncbi:centrosomal protein of 55 kDa-like isoform X1 [Brachyistius frenatus]|uniref:centrosomal protein of 55 kDa-like isoform X1 n=1 Tax=Brachyistius frenatus TaxID=100188 RepID=UPI0037E91A57
MTEHQNYLRDALEKNKQWLEYDQQREAYVKAILARMLWLEKQLNEASRTQQQQHNEDHSVEEKIRQMKEHYEGLLQKAKDELDVLREEVDKIHQNLVDTQNWCKEREKEVEELKQQLQTERLESSQEDHYYTVVEEQHLRDETNDLQERLKEERRRSANSELQANLYQRFMLNHHHAGQEEIADLKRQRDQQDESACEVMPGPSQLSRDGWASMTHGNLMDESFLECPSCQAEYPASHYRELMSHLEICLD